MPDRVFAAFAADTLHETAEHLLAHRDKVSHLDLQQTINEFDDLNQFYLLDLQDVEFESAVNVKGRLKENIAFWKKVGACDWVLKVLERGYYLPFKSIPEKRVFKNQASTGENYEFVCTEIRKLVASSALVEVSLEDLTVVNPLGVVQNANGKLRLILDLRHVNNCLRS